MENQILTMKKDKPFIMAGPCSAESEDQIMETARALKERDVDLFRAGLWKPRTRPNNFEGVGSVGLPWLKRVKEELNLPVTTEVAKGKHVDLALEFGIDVLWIGARTTTNPFSVQEIADALRGVDIPVIVKNPINPDLSLWMGGIERLQKVGIQNISVIHRGFNFFNNTKYRNSPLWQIPIELKSKFPEMMLICDVSHICGRRDILGEVAQQALDLYFDGIMVEVHPDPDHALSDAKQQITASEFDRLIGSLVFRREKLENSKFVTEVQSIRNEIDKIDNHMIQLLSQRMDLAESIGRLKKEHNIPILQSKRWKEILQSAIDKGMNFGLTEEFTQSVFKAIHMESIQHQSRIMKSAEEKGEPASS
jgi:chorismate mutase